MPDGSAILQLESSDLRESYRQRKQAILGQHDLTGDQLFPASFLRSVSLFKSYGDLLEASRLDTKEIERVDSLALDQRVQLDTFIATNTRFNNWNEFFGHAASEFVVRFFQGEELSASPTINRAGVADSSSTTKKATPQTKSSSVGTEPNTNLRTAVTSTSSATSFDANVVDELVENKLAVRLEKHGSIVVIVQVLDGDGRIVNLVLKYIDAIVYMNRMTVAPSRAATIPARYELVHRVIGQTQNPQVLADLYVFDPVIHSRLDAVLFGLKLIPLASLTNYVLYGEGDELDVTIATVGDAFLLGGVALKLAGRGVAALRLATAAASVDVGVSGIQAGQAFHLYRSGEVDAATLKAIEATVRLLGASVVIKDDLLRPIKPGEILPDSVRIAARQASRVAVDASIRLAQTILRGSKQLVAVAGNAGKLFLYELTNQASLSAGVRLYSDATGGLILLTENVTGAVFRAIRKLLAGQKATAEDIIDIARESGLTEPAGNDLLHAIDNLNALKTLTREEADALLVSRGGVDLDEGLLERSLSRSTAKIDPDTGAHISLPSSKRGQWEGVPGKSVFIIKDPGKSGLKVGERIGYVNYNVDLSAHMISKEDQFDIPDIKFDGSDRTRAIKQLVASGRFVDEALAKEYLETNNLHVHHWHKKTVQLVPEPIHNTFNHSGPVAGGR